MSLMADERQGNQIATEVFSSKLRDLGLFKLNIKSAAELVIIDMWRSNELDVPVPEGLESDDVTKLRQVLSDQISSFEVELLMAVRNGKLKAVCDGRDVNGRQLFSEVLIDYFDLRDWLF